MEFKVRSKEQFLERLLFVEIASGTECLSHKTHTCEGYYLIDLPESFIKELKTKHPLFINQLKELII